jgi:hypothetical protein
MMVNLRYLSKKLILDIFLAGKRRKHPDFQKDIYGFHDPSSSFFENNRAISGSLPIQLLFTRRGNLT